MDPRYLKFSTSSIGNELIKKVFYQDVIYKTKTISFTLILSPVLTAIVATLFGIMYIYVVAVQQKGLQKISDRPKSPKLKLFSDEFYL